MQPHSPSTTHTEIRLPRTFGYRNLNALFETCGRVIASNLPLILDGQDNEFFDPLGIAMLGATLVPLQGRRQVRMPWLRADVTSYLARMKVFDLCTIEDVDVRPFNPNDQRFSLVELSQLSHSDEVDLAADHLVTAIVGGFAHDNNTRERYAYPLRYALRELLLNALTHAKKEGRHDAKVWVAAQYYSQKGFVHIAIVDNGCGILATLLRSPKLKEKTHAAAIEAALEPFVTCNPELHAGYLAETANRGIGLTTSRRIVAAASGQFVIVSGNAGLCVQNGQHSPFHLSDGVVWNGVAIHMTFQRSKLPSINVPSLFPDVPNAPQITPRFVA